MRYLISSIVLLFCALSVTAKDIIMLRNGLEKEVYVVQVGNDKIVYKESKGKKAIEQFLNLEDVYMIFTRNVELCILRKMVNVYQRMQNHLKH